MIKIGICNASSKFERHTSSNKHDKEFKTICFVNKSRVYLHVLSWYKFQWQFLLLIILYMNTLKQCIWFAWSHFKEMVI